MSIKLMDRVWETPISDARLKLLLLAIADSANNEGICWPKVATLAKCIDLQERQTRRLLAELETKKWITREKRLEKRVQTSNLIRLNITALSHADTPVSQGTRSHDDTPPRSHDDTPSIPPLEPPCEPPCEPPLSAVPPRAGEKKTKVRKSSPPKSPNHHHPMVVIYREDSGFNALCAAACDLIASAVTNELAWRQIINARRVRHWPMGNIPKAIEEYQRIIAGETLDDVYGGMNGKAHHGNGKQAGAQYETAGQRRSRKFHERMEAGAREIAEIRARRLNSDEPEESGLALARRFGTG